MAGHLKRELAVAPFVEQLAGGGLLDRQSAEHERARRKPQILICLLAFHTNAGDGIGSPKFLFLHDQATWKTAKNRSGGLKAVGLVRSRCRRKRLWSVV